MSLEKLRTLKVMWDTTESTQYHIWIPVLFTIIFIALFGLIGVPCHAFKSKYTNGFFISWILGLVALLGIAGYIGKKPLTSQFIKQDINIVQDKRKLPKLYKERSQYNKDYLNQKRVSLNRRYNASLHYQHKFKKTNTKIKNIKSLESNSDPRHQAITGHGGIHKINKPNWYNNLDFQKPSKAIRYWMSH